MDANSNPKLRILIVDDEVLARERLRILLNRIAAVEIVGECSSANEAIAAIAKDQPDVIFLDVQMPEGNGFDVISQLPRSLGPEVIFVTAHESFAVAAFAAQAVDYLLKPFGDDRLQQALGRAINNINARRELELGRKLETLLTTPKVRPSERMAVRDDGRVVFLKTADIAWVEAANNYCVLHLLDARRLIMRETLSSVEERLGAARFARISRSALVCLDQVKELQLVAHGDYVVVLQNGTRLSLSRKLRGRLEKFLPDGA